MLENEPQNASNTEPTEKEPASAPRRRRGGGRGRMKRAASPHEADEPQNENQESAESPPRDTSRARPSAPKRSRPARRKKAASTPRDASVRGIVQHIRQIIDSLQQTLTDLEQAMGTLDKVEKQQGADMQELEELRSALNQLHYRRTGDVHAHSNRSSRKT